MVNHLHGTELVNNDIICNFIFLHIYSFKAHIFFYTCRLIIIIVIIFHFSALDLDTSSILPVILKQDSMCEISHLNDKDWKDVCRGKWRCTHVNLNFSQYIHKTLKVWMVFHWFCVESIKRTCKYDILTLTFKSDINYQNQRINQIQEPGLNKPSGVNPIDSVAVNVQ